MAIGLRQFQYFVAIADAGALSHAAQTLNVAQSALSHHVAQMEAELGVRLIERRPRGIALTPAGERLCEHARSIISSVKKAEDDIRTFSEEPVGAIAVGLPHTAVDLVALPLMRAVRANCPQVALSIHEGLSPTNIARVLSGEIDLALAYNPPEDSRLSRKLLLSEEMCLVGRGDLVGENERPIAFGDIPPGPIVSPYSSGTLKAIVASHMLRSKLKPSEVLEIDSLTALRRALESGFSCSILPRASITEQLADGRLHARPIIEPQLDRALEQISLQDRPRTRAFVELERILTDTVREEALAGRWPVLKVFGTRRRAVAGREHHPVAS